MTTYNTIEILCPGCKTHIRINVLTSTNSVGGQETDFQTHAIGFSPLPLMINTCPRCGYTGDCHAFGEQVCVPDALKQALCADYTPIVAARGVPRTQCRF